VRRRPAACLLNLGIVKCNIRKVGATVVERPDYIADDPAEVVRVKQAFARAKGVPVTQVNLLSAFRRCCWSKRRNGLDILHAEERYGDLADGSAQTLNNVHVQVGAATRYSPPRTPESLGFEVYGPPATDEEED
jgi:hypothetical protein